MSSNEPITQAMLDAVYAERDILVALLARWALDRGLRAGLRRATDAGPGWQETVVIALPQGEVSWHIPDRERALAPFLTRYAGIYEGYTNEVKAERIMRAIGAEPADGYADGSDADEHRWAIFAASASSPIYADAASAADAVARVAAQLPLRLGGILPGFSVQHAAACLCQAAATASGQEADV